MKIPSFLRKTISQYAEVGGHTVEYLEQIENPAPHYPMSRQLRDFYIAKGYLTAMHMVWLHNQTKGKK